jgi:hypothetical protein
MNDFFKRKPGETQKNKKKPKDSSILGYLKEERLKALSRNMPQEPEEKLPMYMQDDIFYQRYVVDGALIDKRGGLGIALELQANVPPDQRQEGLPRDFDVLLREDQYSYRTITYLRKDMKAWNLDMGNANIQAVWVLYQLAGTPVCN